MVNDHMLDHKVLCIVDECTSMNRAPNIDHTLLHRTFGICYDGIGLCISPCKVDISSCMALYTNENKRGFFHMEIYKQHAVFHSGIIQRFLYKCVHSLTHFYKALYKGTIQQIQNMHWDGMTTFHLLKNDNVTGTIVTNAATFSSA